MPVVSKTGAPGCVEGKKTGWCHVRRVTVCLKRRVHDRGRGDANQIFALSELPQLQTNSTLRNYEENRPQYQDDIHNNSDL